MVRERFENLEPEKQERLFEAAAEEFGEKGFEGASLNRILDRSGMSKGSLYYYFEDKADLFATVAERAVARLFSLLGMPPLEQLTAEGYWSAFERMTRRSIELLEGRPWVLKLSRVVYRLRRQPGGGARTAGVFDLARRWMRDVLARGQELGVVRSDLPLPLLVELVMAAGETFDEWMLERWEQLSADERARLVDAQMSVFRQMLSPAPREV